jgi:soluble lytic murein transglycosylase-like protein
MSRTPELIALVNSIAVAHGLETALVCAVIEQESNWNTWAVRYEPAFMHKYVWPQYSQGKFGQTEAQMRAQSWGLMQVMGQVAREFGFIGSFLTELCEPRLGVDLGCVVLAHRMAGNAGIAYAALLAYNGGADPAYPNQVLARVAGYKEAVV